jgi:hypothetical protein
MATPHVTTESARAKNAQTPHGGKEFPMKFYVWIILVVLAVIAIYGAFGAWRTRKLEIDTKALTVSVKK